MANRSRFSLEHLFGNTTIQRNIFPRVIGRVRRTDPDGGSAVPYFPSLATKTLSIEYTKEVASVVTTFTVPITFAANGLQDAITQINTLDAAHLEGQDLDGFLAIRNKNGGKTHYVAIVSGTAAATLGYEIAPFPGHKSVAGEISPSPTNRTQKNPPGTAGLAKDETLDSAAINRAISGFADVISRLLREQDREVVGFGQVTLTGANIFTIGSFTMLKFPSPVAGMRIPLLAFPDSALPSQPTKGELASLFRIQNADGDEAVLSSKLVPRVLRVLWGNPNTISTTNGSVAFPTYLPLPSPSAFSVFGNNGSGPVTKVVKLAAVTISEISGNVVKCAGTPNFITNYVQVGDTARIKNSSVATPFSHNGEFIVDEIISESVLVLRPKSKNDGLADSASEMPGGLNQGTTGMGEVEILVGNYLNGPGIIIMTDVSPAQAGELNGMIFHYPTGSRFKDAPVERFGRGPKGGIAGLISRLGSISGLDGASFIGAAANSDLLTTTVRAQLNEIATGWAKLDRANTWTKPQNFQGEPDDDSPAVQTTQAPTGDRKLIWEFNDGLGNSNVRLYWSGTNGFIPGFEITVNCFWDPLNSEWDCDVEFDTSMKLTLNTYEWKLETRNFSGVHPWPDGSWDATPFYIDTFGLPDEMRTYLQKGGLTVGNPEMGQTSARLQFSKNTSQDQIAATDPARTLLIEDVSPVPSDYDPATKQQMRVYVRDPGIDAFGGFGSALGDALEVTFNCAWYGTQWYMDDPNYPAVIYSFDPTIGFTIKTRNTYGETWSGLDSFTFDDVLVEPEEDQSVAGTTGWNHFIGFTNSYDPYPGSGPAYKNLISDKQIVKAWGFIDVLNQEVRDGFNISSLSEPSPGVIARVHFSHGFAPTAGKFKYGVLMSSNAVATQAVPCIYAKTDDYFDYFFYNPNTGSAINYSIASESDLVFAIYGTWESVI